MDVGVNWTLAGHSERRAMFNETIEVVGNKTKRALDVGMNVIFCCGEQLEERKAEKTLDVLFE